MKVNNLEIDGVDSKQAFYYYYAILDDLLMKEQDGQKLPYWVTAELYEEMKILGRKNFDNFVSTKALTKMNAGLFLGHLKSKIENLVANKSSMTLAGVAKGFKQQTKKLNVYSAVGAISLFSNDITLSNLLNLTERNSKNLKQNDVSIANVLAALQVYEGFVWSAATVS